MIARRVYGEPGTLYARCGGVFGVSAFVDRCMDKWMACKTLNDNAMVARWHQSAQRPGFKFLVVQIVCSLTGGPQQYTGRPMDQAHKHLNISEDEWDVFMEIFNDVCGEFSLPAEDIDDLNALMISMEEECVVYPGERPRRDPGPWRPGGNSVYGRCGGVYPLALFSDRLVDALVQDERFAVPTDAKRTPAALKYLLTEKVCRESGGPEVVTADGERMLQLRVPAGSKQLGYAELCSKPLYKALRLSTFHTLVSRRLTRHPRLSQSHLSSVLSRCLANSCSLCRVSPPLQ